MADVVQFKGWITFEDAIRLEKLVCPRKIRSVSGVFTIKILVTIAVVVIGMKTSWLNILLDLVAIAFCVNFNCFLIDDLRTSHVSKSRHLWAIKQCFCMC